MFLKAVGAGLNVLLHWQVWVAAISSILVLFAFQAFIATTMGKKQSVGSSPSGCLTMVVGGTILQSLVNSAFFTALIPIILGGQSALPLGVLFEHCGRIATIGFLGMAASLLVSFIPIVSGSHAVPSFVQGVVVCRLLAGTELEAIATSHGVTLVYPGFWQSVGFVIIAVAMGLLAIGVATILLSLVDHWDKAVAPFVPPAMGSLGIVFAYLPVFMYMKYAVLGLRFSGLAT